MFALLASFAAATAEPEQFECTYDRESMLALDIVAFDQTEGMGWRPYYHAGCYIEAAEMLREWLAVHGDDFDPASPLDQNIRNIVVWHEAQMWAFGGRNDQALPIFERTYIEADTANGSAWNLYVDGTLAFLRRDRPALESAMTGLAAIPKPPNWDNAVGVDGQPISLPWPQNLNVLEGLLRCWDEPYAFAYVCRDIPQLRP